MKSPFRLALIALIALAGVLSLVGCGGTPPTVESFNTFKGHVMAKKWDSAYDMLSKESKAKIKDKDALQKLCESPKFEGVFTNRGNVRNQQFVPGTEDAAEGTVMLDDESGKIVKNNVGKWTVVKEDGAWKVNWTLSTSTNDAHDPTKD